MTMLKKAVITGKSLIMIFAILIIVPAVVAILLLLPYLPWLGNTKSAMVLAGHAIIPIFTLGTWTYVLIKKYKNKTRQLEESEARYRALVENATDGITLIINDDHHLYANPSLLKMLGYTLDAFNSLKHTQLIPDTPAGKRLMEYQKKIHSNEQIEPTRFESQLLKKDGTIIDVLISVGPISIKGSNGAIAMITDLTERKKSEHELQRIQKLDALGILAGGIAHDFNNILTTILGSVSLAKRASNNPPRLAQLMDSAQKATLRAKDLTTQLLTFSKGGEPIREAVLVEKLIRESVELSLRNVYIECPINIAEDIWPVDVDQGQIFQVISNLIINADQAMPQGGTIEIDANNLIDCDDRRFVKIDIKDNGTGISEEHLPHIFDPYFTTKTSGNGLGLAVSYSILTKHDGKLKVESKSQVGTTMSIYLPASRITPTPRPVSEPAIPTPKCGRALIMDDDTEVLKTAGQMLNELGYEYYLARDGEEAIELYREKAPFDFVLMDLTIPGGMGGHETVQRLLSIDPELNAIVSSGYYDDPVMSDYYSYGFKGVVQKPYTVEELGKAINKVA